MAHFTSHDAHPREQECKATTARNARVGLVLFAVYLAFYAAFVVLTAFAADWMQTEIARVNVAIYSGFGLIVGAFVLALAYLCLCRSNARD
ncbi:MAG: DUF485 domain-containing protein [Planctomycetota bacterium]|nr:MAG: DUF485 domain-containing protein [Planctomycetota bacterium]